jgi:hypothetical protein
MTQPGCYGLVVCFEPSSAFCNGCTEMAACGEIVQARRARLAAVVNTSKLRVTRGTPETPVRSAVVPTRTLPMPDPEPDMETPVSDTPKTGSLPKLREVGQLTKKALELKESLEKLGCDAPAMLRAGRMPLEGYDKLSYFKIACQLYLTEGCLDRTKYRDTLRRQLGWSDSTANSHMAIIASYMVGMGLLAPFSPDRYIRVAA